MAPFHGVFQQDPPLSSQAPRRFLKPECLCEPGDSTDPGVRRAGVLEFSPYVLLTVLDLIDLILVWGSWRISASGVPGSGAAVPCGQPLCHLPTSAARSAGSALARSSSA